MEITEVKVFPVKDNDKLKAYASIVFDDCFVIRDLRVISGTMGLFVAMPSRKRKDGSFRDTAHPLNMETRDKIEVETLYNYQDFAGFLSAFKDVTGHLRSPEDYELITYRLMERLKAQNILHAEVIVSVGVCLWRKQDFPRFSKASNAAARAERKDFGISLLWIFDAIRQFGAEKAQIPCSISRSSFAIAMWWHSASAAMKAGPPEWFAGVYARGAEHGLHLTAHAGESAGPESIWGALNLKAERIGHGLTAGAGSGID